MTWPEIMGSGRYGLREGKAILPRRADTPSENSTQTLIFQSLQLVDVRSPTSL